MALVALAFLIVPIVELAVIIQVGSWLGVWPTIGMLVLISVLGAWLVKWQGLATLRRVQVDLEQGRLPGTHLVDGALILVAGVLMLTPGFLTDVAGIVLLLPPTRAGIRTVLISRFRGRIQTYTVRPPPSGEPGGGQGSVRPGGDIIDV